MGHGLFNHHTPKSQLRGHRSIVGQSTTFLQTTSILALAHGMVEVRRFRSIVIAAQIGVYKICDARTHANV